MTPRKRRFSITILAALAALIGGTAFAQTSALEVNIREAQLSADGTTKLVVSVVGSAVPGAGLGQDNFSISESGQNVDAFNVESLSGAASGEVVSVSIVMDVSGSTAGAPIADAKNAARSFVNRLPASVRIELIAFSVNPSVRVPFTTDKGRILNGISGLQAGGGTALYDAVILAARELGPLPGQHNMVVFSDGGDTDSKPRTLADAITAAQRAKTTVTSVGLATTAFDPNVMRQLAGAVKGGRALSVSQSSQLTIAFTQVAQTISSQYILSYISDRLEPKTLDIAVTAKVGSIQASDSSSVINTRTGEKPSVQLPGGGPHLYQPKALVPFLSSKTGYWVGIASVFAAAMLFLGILLYAPTKGRAAAVLQRGLRLYSRSDRKKEKQREEGFLTGTAVGRRAVELVERVPKSEAFEARIQQLLDRAAWPLRSTEFIVLQILGAVVGALLGFGLFGRWWLGIVLLVGGAIVPRLVLAQRVAKREAAFLSQLPDVLQLLSGSLQAGYGFMQAIDTVAKEATPPASTEFSRVLAESRLGMPVEDALNSMADRVGGSDFRWVVLAINIQRQVGGNLAALLSTVANTLREREMVRRQIKVLSAEGRLSAIILVALPFLLAGYISIVNPGYLGELTKATIGKIMIVVGVVLMGIGIAWMRKIIKIDV
jgi:tight adherence protein B